MTQVIHWLVKYWQITPYMRVVAIYRGENRCGVFSATPIVRPHKPSFLASLFSDQQRKLYVSKSLDPLHIYKKYRVYNVTPMHYFTSVSRPQPPEISHVNFNRES
jgi:hypothetical protein